MSHHGCMTTHNLRFYYNPITSLLEPIHYDGSTSIGSSSPLMIGDPQWDFLSSGIDYGFQIKYLDTKKNSILILNIFLLLFFFIIELSFGSTVFPYLLVGFVISIN